MSAAPRYDLPLLLALCLATSSAHGEVPTPPELEAPAPPRAAAVRPLPGVEIDYDLLEQDDDPASRAARLQGRVAVPNGQLVGSMLVRPVAGAGPRVARLDTRWQGSLPGGWGQTLVVGDSVGSGGGWSRPVRYGGLRFGRALAVRPGFDVAPQTEAASAALPSSGYAMSTGDDATRPSTHPAVQALMAPEGTAAGLPVGHPGPLPAGASDYEVEAGRLRTGWGTTQDRYDGAYAAGAWRYGLTATLAAEARAEWTPGHAAAGLELGQSWGEAGTLRAVLAQSQAAQGTGLRWGLGWVRNAEGATWSMDWESSDRGFSPLAATPHDTTLRNRLSAGAQLPLVNGPWGRASAHWRYTRHVRWGESATGALEVGAHLPVGERSRLSMTYAANPDGQPGWKAGLTLAVPLEREHAP